MTDDRRSGVGSGKWKGQKNLKYKFFSSKIIVEKSNTGKCFWGYCILSFALHLMAKIH